MLVSELAAEDLCRRQLLEQEIEVLGPGQIGHEHRSLSFGPQHRGQFDKPILGHEFPQIIGS